MPLSFIVSIAILVLSAKSGEGHGNWEIGCGSGISPKPGHWEATRDLFGVEKELASFDVDDDGDVKNFKFIFYISDNECVIELDELAVDDNAFSVSPDDVGSDYAIEGEFDSATSLTGTFIVKSCASRNADGTWDLLMDTGGLILQTENTWTAEWKGP